MQHGTEILGGMWGYYNSRNKKNSKLIFEKILDKQLSRKYNGDLKSPKGADQFFLSAHVYPLIKHEAIVHDSYLCKNYEHSSPFPTRRVGACFVGMVETTMKTDLCGINSNKSVEGYTCPVDCRPKDHLDWTQC